MLISGLEDWRLKIKKRKEPVGRKETEGLRWLKEKKRTRYRRTGNITGFRFSDWSGFETADSILPIFGIRVNFQRTDLYPLNWWFGNFDSTTFHHLLNRWRLLSSWVCPIKTQPLLTFSAAQFSFLTGEALKSNLKFVYFGSAQASTLGVIHASGPGIPQSRLLRFLRKLRGIPDV